MKTILIFLLSCLTASAQYSVNSGIQTNRVVSAGATSNYTSSVSIARTRYLAARVSVTTADTGASGDFFTLWQTSLDNTNWYDAFVITNTISGTNIINAVTNQVDIGSLQYLRLVRATNSATHLITNFYATVTYKVSVAQDVISAIGYNVQPASSVLTNVSILDGTELAVSWTNLVDVPAGFFDDTDDEGSGVATNTFQITTESTPTGSHAIDTLYTNLPQRTIMVGSAVLNSGVSGSADITLTYTNNGTAYSLPMAKSAGIASSVTVPFAVPLSTNATFKFVSTFGTGASGHITNTVIWKQ